MRKRKIKLLFLVSILLICIGFAVLSNSLSIYGFFTFPTNTWNIYLDNIELNENSNTTELPIINDDKDTLTFSSTLNKPGDYYEFNVDVVNNSTIDAMLGSITVEGITSTYSDYLSCVITYSNGTTPNTNDILYKTARVTFNVRLYYKDITNEQIPSTVLTPTINITINYKQANSNAVLVGDTNHWNYDFTGSIQSFNAPLNAIYKLETWGAQGYVNEYYDESYGAYSTGLINLDYNNDLFITVGEKGKNKKVGGTITSYPNSYAYSSGTRADLTALSSGGGSTHIATQTGLLTDLEEYQGELVEDNYYVSDVIIMVAGGGGGASHYYTNIWSGYGGNAGGIIGNTAQRIKGNYYNGTGGTQTSGGLGGNKSDETDERYSGKFGDGGMNSESTNAGGGGGYYGGGASWGSGGGGGSSYIASSKLESNATYTKHMTCFNCTTSDEVKQKQFLIHVLINIQHQIVQKSVMDMQKLHL